MKKKDILLDALNNNHFLNNDFNFDVLSKLKTGYESKWFKRDEYRLYYKFKGDFVEVEDAAEDAPVFVISDEVEIPEDVISIAPKGIKSTTFGRVIANMIMLEYGLSGKLAYIDGEITIEHLEKLMSKKLRPTPENLEEMEKGSLDGPIFYVYDFDKLSTADLFIQELAHLITVSGTKQSLLKPKDLEEVKAKVLQKLRKKYGKKLFTTELHAVEFVDEVKEHYKKFLQDDPSWGIVLSSKIFNSSFSKLNIAFGWEHNAFNPDTPDKMILKSLSEGMSLVDDEFIYYVNSSRAGSYFRGVATQESGTIAKNLILAVLSQSYVDGDCGTKWFRTLVVKKTDNIEGRYMLNAGKPEVITDSSKLIGKEIKLRDAMVCQSPIGSLCRICVGEAAFRNPIAIILQTMTLGGDLVNSDMKKMHSAGSSATTIDFS